MRVVQIPVTPDLVAAVPGLSPVPSSTQPSAPFRPATKLEGFTPAPGSVVTLGYDELGRIGSTLSTSGFVVVEARLLHSGTDAVQGMTVTIHQGPDREETAFVDREELADLVRGVDALLKLKGNPTKFKNFEVRYSTKGDLSLRAFNNASGEVGFAIEAGRVMKAKRLMTPSELQKIRAMFQAAAERLDVEGLLSRYPSAVMASSLIVLSGADDRAR
jgi:hypothetical protein